MRECTPIPHPSVSLTIERCGPEDLEPMLDRLETLLHEDYFFRRKHFAAILARPQAAVYAIRVEGDFAAIAIVYEGSTLQNLYVHPEHRRLGVGTAVLRYLNPQVVRAKSNMSQGDPTGFYAQNGYKSTGVDPTKPHITLMNKATPVAVEPSCHPVNTITDAKRAQLDAARVKSIAKRKRMKQDSEFIRLRMGGVDAGTAHRLAYGEGSDCIPPTMPTDWAEPNLSPHPVPVAGSGAGLRLGALPD